MPSPKHTPGETRPEAIRQFTDREEFVEAFEKAISELPLEENKVLIYYGVGGIGKTSLRKELGRLLDEEHSKVAWAVLDFETQTHRDVEGALSWLSKEEMTGKYKVLFPSFELALSQYWQKSRPHTPLRTEEVPLLEEGDILADLVSIGADIPGVGFAAKSIKLGVKLHQYLNEWWTKKGQRLLGQLHEMTPKEIEERLPMFWAEDLKAFTKRKDQPRPAVLFIDTYEALWEGQRTEARFFLRDEWVRELVAQLPEVLWVIAGRDKLRWGEHEPDWGNYLEQHLVGRLAENDCRTFLTSCEITEEAIQRAIVEGSEGVPFYLDVSVDAYLEMKEQGKTPSPSDFGRTPKKVVDRFLSHLEEPEEETLKVLSVARLWDRSLFKMLIKEFETGYPATALPKLCRFSFIQEERVPGTWTIHPLMREGLEEHQDAELRGEVHQYLFDHYNQQLEGLESTAIGDLHKAALTEAFHHGEHALDTDELLEWFTTVGEIFGRAALWQFLIPLYEVFAKLVEDRSGAEHPNTAGSLGNLAELYRQQGRYEEAEPLHERALGIQEKVLGPEHLDTAGSLNNLALLYDKWGRYEEAEPLYERALGIKEKILGPNDPDTATSLNNLAAFYVLRGRYEEAGPLHERALKIRERVLGPEHPNTAAGLNNLAMLYYQRGRYGEAGPLHERALKIQEKVLGPEHPHTFHSRNALVRLYYEQGRYGEAEPLFERALDITEEILGPDHPDTAICLNNLAVLYCQQGRYEEAEPPCKRALRIREKVLGPEHPDTADILASLAELYRLQGSYEEAEPLYERVLKIREKVFGPDHPDTIQTREALEDVQEN